MSGVKELTWWSHHSSRANDIFSYERYLDMNDIAAETILSVSRIDESGTISNPIIFGDGSPNTMFWNNRWKDYGKIRNATDTDNMLLTPKFMHHLQPEAKLIVILRDPVTFTFSTYAYFSSASISSEHFHKCVLISIQMMTQCEQEFSHSYCTLLSYKDFNLTG